MPRRPPPPASPAATPLVATALQTLTDEFGAAAAVELIESFLRDTPERLEDARRLVAAGDQSALARTAHSVAGSSSIFGLEAMRECGLEIEDLIRNGQLEAAARLVPQLERAYVAAAAALRCHVDQLRATTS